mgnify:CR=1 FL=1
MNFTLTEQQEMIRRTVRDIAQKVVAPRAAEMDRTGEYPWDIKEILARHTGRSLEDITRDTDRDFFMDANAAKEYGIIDEILTGAKVPVAAGGGSSKE